MYVIKVSPCIHITVEDLSRISMIGKINSVNSELAPDMIGFK